MADAGVVNALPSANDAQEHPVAAPAPAPGADKGKGEVQPWEGRPCVVLALQAATAPVDGSSGDSRREGEEEEDEERDSEATPEGMGETSPLR